MKKSLCIFLSLFMMSITFVSCNSDSNTNYEPNFPVEIIGVWEGVEIEESDAPQVKPSDEEVKPGEEPAFTDTRLLIYDNGLILVVVREAPDVNTWKESKSGAWAYDLTTDRMAMTFSKDKLTVFTVKKLDLTTLVITTTVEVKGTDDKTEKKDITYTFRRITK